MTKTNNVKHNSHIKECFTIIADILGEIKKAGFQEPSPIQKQAWPIALQGIDLIGIAQVCVCVCVCMCVCVIGVCPCVWQHLCNLRFVTFLISEHFALKEVYYRST